MKLVAAYAEAQGMFRTKDTPDPVFTDVLKLDLGSVEPSLAGPKRPQDRVALKDVKAGFAAALDKEFGKGAEADKRVPVAGRGHDLGHGDVVIAAITSCTNTSNPNVMVGAGLLARNAVAKGLTVKPWVKTSLAPGSQVVGEYLAKSGLQKDLDKLGFNLVGYGCTTCIGNSGPLPAEISKTINEADLVAAAVLSGNRNFEGRVNQDVRANYLASPPLVVAYAIAGTVNFDFAKTPLGTDKAGKKVFLKDIWPSSDDIAAVVKKTITKKVFERKYGHVFEGDEAWTGIAVKGGLTYAWDRKSTYVQNPPYFVGMGRTPEQVGDIVDARILGLFLDSITTDHISPAGSDQGIFTGRPISDRPQGQARELQPVRYPARQPRSDDARHLRQHPHQEPDGSGRRRRRHHPLSVRRADADLRRRDAVQDRERPAGHLCRQGIRHGVVSRLGREGDRSARCPRRRLPVVRTHPPIEPDRNGCDPAGVRRGHLVADTRFEGR